MTGKKPPVSAVKSAQRVLEVFEFFSERQEAATVMDVARGLGYPQSSTSSLMRSLLHLGYLSYDRHTRQYMPTLRIVLMGTWIQETMYSDGNLMRIMQDLHRQTGETIILGMQNDIHAQYIHSIQGGEMLRLYVRAGTLRPLARCSIGKMLLAVKPEKEVRSLVARINATEESSENRVDLAELLRDLERCRRDGYSVTNGNVTQGAGVVSVLLPEGTGPSPMALGIGAPLQRLRNKKREFITLLQDVVHASPLRQ